MGGYSRLVLGGTNAGGDSWSIGFSVVGLASLSEDNSAAWLSAVATDIGTAANSSGTSGFLAVAATDTLLKTLRLYNYPAGPPPAAVTAEFTYATPKAGFATGKAPYECAVVATLETGYSGRKSRGRVYVPGDGVSTGTHQINQAACDEVANGIAAVINAINASTVPGDVGNPFVVVSGAGGTGPQHLVTRVRVDSKVDVQRRRQNKVVATATSTVAIG